jgi:SprT-like family
MDSTHNNEMSWASWMTPVDDEPTREAWLLSAIDRMARSLFPAFKQPRWRVTCGWQKGVRGGKHAIGQCWDRTSSNDGTYEIFISPELDQPGEILHTLAHEMIHAIVGCEVGHKGEFVTRCKAIGLVKPWTATTPGAELAAKLAIYALQLGPYPHARLNDLRKRQTTRMLKATCPNPDCEIGASTDSDKPYTIRITQQWADAGMPSCPCGTLMELDGANDDPLREAA